MPVGGSHRAGRWSEPGVVLVGDGGQGGVGDGGTGFGQGGEGGSDGGEDRQFGGLAVVDPFDDAGLAAPVREFVVFGLGEGGAECGGDVETGGPSRRASSFTRPDSPGRGDSCGLAGRAAERLAPPAAGIGAGRGGRGVVLERYSKTTHGGGSAKHPEEPCPRDPQARETAPAKVVSRQSHPACGKR